MSTNEWNCPKQPPAPMASIPEVVASVRLRAFSLDFNPGSLVAFNYPRHVIATLVGECASGDKPIGVGQQFAAEGLPLRLFPVRRVVRALNAGIVEVGDEILFLTSVQQRCSVNTLGELVVGFTDPAVGAVSGELIAFPGAARAKTNGGVYWKHSGMASSVRTVVVRMTTTCWGGVVLFCPNVDYWIPFTVKPRRP